MRLLAIDPGNVQSAAVVLCGDKVEDMRLQPNHDLLQIIRWVDADHLAIECMQNYGMSAGRSIFDTATWAGRFIEAFCDGDDTLFTQLPRPEVKRIVCGKVRGAGDKDVREALMKRYGGSKSTAVGVKAKPGPLYGIKKDIWAALAVGVAYRDTLNAG